MKDIVKLFDKLFVNEWGRIYSNYLDNPEPIRKFIKKCVDDKGNCKDKKRTANQIPARDGSGH